MKQKSIVCQHCGTILGKTDTAKKVMKIFNEHIKTCSQKNEHVHCEDCDCGPVLAERN